ncbi:lysine histidine transporter-like 2 [Apium graveolens]|uniref:lysine histidine transporter-like 2 n=1 Tax=Apium graveolens TaxID=4045 RepID=UPI003D7B38E2
MMNSGNYLVFMETSRRFMMFHIIEFYDVRSAEAALRALNKSQLAGKLNLRHPDGNTRVFNALGQIAFAFAGHAMTLEIHTTISSIREKPSRIQANFLCLDYMLPDIIANA